MDIEHKKKPVVSIPLIKKDTCMLKLGSSIYLLIE